MSKHRARVVTNANLVHATVQSQAHVVARLTELSVQVVDCFLTIFEDQDVALYAHHARMKGKHR